MLTGAEYTPRKKNRRKVKNERTSVDSHSFCVLLAANCSGGVAERRQDIWSSRKPFDSRQGGHLRIRMSLRAKSYTRTNILAASWATSGEGKRRKGLSRCCNFIPESPRSSASLRSPFIIGRRPAFTKTEVGIVWGLHRKGSSVKEIADELKRSESGVRNVFRRGPGVYQSKRACKSSIVPPSLRRAVVRAAKNGYTTARTVHRQPESPVGVRRVQ